MMGVEQHKKPRSYRRTWSVYCPDGILWEGGLGRLDAEMSVCEANGACPCGGIHKMAVDAKPILDYKN